MVGPLTRAALVAGLVGMVLPVPAEVAVRSRSVTIDTAEAEFVVHPSGCLETRLSASQWTLDEPVGSGPCTSSATIDGRRVSGLVLAIDDAKVSTSPSAGIASRVDIPARWTSPSPVPLETTMRFEAWASEPNAITSTLTVRNRGKNAIQLEAMSLPLRRLAAPRAGAHANARLWSFHGSSERVGQGELARLEPGFSRTNVVGVPGRRGVGGGLPVVAVWSPSVGIAVGHADPLPVSASIPIEVSAQGRTSAQVRFEPRKRLAPGEAYETPRAFHAVFAGDHYEGLRAYARLLHAQNVPTHAPSTGSFEATWSSWGYGEGVSFERMRGVLPKLEELGIRAAVLDDQWFDAFGDWRPRADTFPGETIKSVVAAYHAQGVKIALWWLPLAVETGDVLPRGTRHRTAKIGLQHPEWLVRDERGRPARITRGLSVLCPALPAVREYHRSLVERFVRDWGFDGHKLDAVFSVPRCFSPGHGHRSPDDTWAGLRTLYDEIHSATLALSPHAVIQICSCGTAPHHAWTPYLTQAVAADPWGSAQRRQRLEMFKGLLGPSAAVSGDHVELAEHASTQGGEPARGRDFASTLGLGGVVSTRFVWPEAPKGSEDVLLTPEKEAHWKKWLALYREKRLFEGTFRNLYVYGFDVPEAYVIEKEGAFYYAFFTPEPDGVFEGDIELRGMARRRYRVQDYVSSRAFGTVEGPKARVTARFSGFLLLEAKER